MQKAKLFTKDFMLDASISSFCSLNYFVLLINMVGFSTTVFGASPAEAGMAAGIYVIGGLISRVFLGKYIELIGRKRMLMLALAGALIMSGMYFLVSSLLILYIVRFLHGLTYGLVSSCTGDIVAKLVPQERRGEGLGYFYLSVTLATAVGPFLGMEFGRNGDYNLVFSVGLVMYSLALISATFLKVPEETLNVSQTKDARSFTFRNLFQVSAIPLATVSMVFFFSYSSVLSYISTYSETVDLVEAASYFYLAVSVGTILSRLTSGRIYDAKGANIIMIPSFIIYVVAMLMFSSVKGILMLYLVGFLFGFSISIVYAINQAIVVSKSPPYRYGVTTSTYAGFTDIGTGLGPTVMGVLIASVGFHYMYVICACIGAVAFAMYLLIHGMKEGLHPPTYENVE